MRPHVAAVYAFARVADDMADEGIDPPAIRQARLDAWRRRFHAAALRLPDDFERAGRDTLILAALGHTIRALDLPVPLFDDLLSAFRQDITTTRYASWPDLFDYCRRSANPIGRLVLRIAGYRDPDLDRSADALCTALQLTNFWQDFGRDWTAGR
jgi:phytoene synthase